MRTTRMIAIGCAGALLALGGCSKQTQDNAKRTADSVGDDMATAASNAGVAAKGAANDAGKDLGKAAKQGASALSVAANKAADETSDALNTAGKKADDAGHRVEANVQGESVKKAKSD